MADFRQFDGLGLSTYLLQKLQRRCIKSRYELLVTSNAELMEITGLPEVGVMEIKQKLGEDYFPRQQRISFKNKTNTKVYTTGIENIDILAAKIPLKSGSIWEICGGSSVGKTQLCHTIALNFVAQSYGIVLYIDTKCDFSGTRVMDMLRSRNVSNQHYGRMMQEILVERTNSAEATCDILKKLLAHLTAGTNADLTNIKLVIIDSLPAVFFTHRTEIERLRGKYLLATLNNLAYKLSKEHHIAFIYVNLLVNIEEEQLAARDGECEGLIEEVSALPSHLSGKDMRPALGEYWNRAPRLRLSMEIPKDSTAMTNERTLRIIKSCYSAIGGMCRLRITSAGVSGLQDV